MADHYKITDQRPGTDAAPGGPIHDVVVVTFEAIPSGAVGVCRIPSREYTTDNVAQIVGAQADVLNQVADL